MAELADARDLGSRGATRAGSTPVTRIFSRERRRTPRFKAIPQLFSFSPQPPGTASKPPADESGGLANAVPNSGITRNVPVVRAEQAGRAGLWRRGFSFLACVGLGLFGGCIPSACQTSTCGLDCPPLQPSCPPLPEKSTLPGPIFVDEATRHP